MEEQVLGAVRASLITSNFHFVTTEKEYENTEPPPTSPLKLEAHPHLMTLLSQARQARLGPRLLVTGSPNQYKINQMLSKIIMLLFFVQIPWTWSLFNLFRFKRESQNDDDKLRYVTWTKNMLSSTLDTPTQHLVFGWLISTTIVQHYSVRQGDNLFIHRSTKIHLNILAINLCVKQTEAIWMTVISNIFVEIKILVASQEGL